MPSVADSLFSKNQNVIAEIIGNRVMNKARMLDPVTRRLVIEPLSTTGTNSGQFQVSRGARIRQRFSGSLAGVIQPGHMTDWRAILGEKTQAFGNAPFYLLNLSQRFPKATDSPVPLAWGFTLELFALEYNLPLTLGMLTMDATKANIMDVAGLMLEGLAKHFALWIVGAPFLRQSKQYRLATFGAAGTISIDAANKRITFEAADKTNLRVAEGQGVDLFDDNAAFRRVNQDGAGNRIKLFVSYMDTWTYKIVLQWDPNAAFINPHTGAAPVAADFDGGGFITWLNAKAADGKFYNLYSLFDFWKWGGASAADKRILGDLAVTDTADDILDITERAAFKSGRFPQGGGPYGPMTERKLYKDLSHAMSALAPFGGHLDTWVGSPGIIQSLWENELTKEMTIRNGPSRLGLGMEGEPTISVHGRTISLFESGYLEDGLACSFRRNGNLKLLVPQAPEGTTEGGPIPSEPGLEKLPLHFVGTALGAEKPMMPIRDSSGSIVGGSEMPGFSVCQLVLSEQLQAAVWEGVQTSRGTSDA